MKRGRILRDTNSGPGIVSVDGTQKSFSLEQHWRSATPPKVGGVVDVELGADGEVIGVAALDETTLAREQAQFALAAATTHGRKYAGLVMARVGIPTLAAVGLLAVAWLFLSTLSVQVTASYKESITFYEVMKIAHNGTALDSLKSLDYQGAGVWGILMVAALLAPIAPHFHPNKYLKLGYVAPLALMLVVLLQLYLSISAGMSKARGLANGFGGAEAAAMAEQMLEQMLDTALKAISLGLGFYIAAAIAAGLSFIGIRSFLAANTKV